MRKIKLVPKKTKRKTPPKSESPKRVVATHVAAAPKAASNVIRVPKPARASFNPGRLLIKNALIKNQIEHFHQLELQLPPEQRTNINFEKITTEGQASEYIRKMTAILHPKVAKTGGR